jgi:gas vesicle protein GvpA/GvpJ/GvpM family
MSGLEPRNQAQAPVPAAGAAQPAGRASDLGDILERVLDKGIVIAGDIQVNLLDIELLTIRLRLIVASVDTAREIGINWWETDPRLKAGGDETATRGGALEERVDRLERQLEAGSDGDSRRLEDENRKLRKRLQRLERELESGEGDG